MQYSRSWIRFGPFKFSLFICICYVIQILKYTCVDSFKYYHLYSWIVQISEIVNQQIWNQILSKEKTIFLIYKIENAAVTLPSHSMAQYYRNAVVTFPSHSMAQYY